MRTKYLDTAGNPKYTNRLINDSSPYLVQHAHNPVDWYPWGEEAFAAARAEDKPIFLSIGYSTCHWCHVMERESFDNEDIAAFLNEHFVAIKLDREQRPDLDEIYMTGLQLMTGQGGWPMSNFITEAGKPFFTGTYFPPDGFLDLLKQIAAAWQSQRDEVIAQAEQIFGSIEKHTVASGAAGALDKNLPRETAQNLLASFDEEYGGFGRAPKFPNESYLWLLFEAVISGETLLSGPLLKTLDKMAEGGLYDQVAGGFHRYSVDQKWLVPHFEKMLYNQGQLLRLYAAGWSLTNQSAYHRVLTQTLDYLAREMTSPDGGFYSATDADTEGEEGKFFIWTDAELREVLHPDEYALAKTVYGITSEGNFEGANVLHLTTPLETLVSDSEQLQKLDALQNKLRNIRSRRSLPFLDEKIIVSWNALTISAIAQVELLTGMVEYRQLAIEAAEVLWQKHIETDEAGHVSELMRSRLGNEVSIQGALEDYAYLAEAYLRLNLISAEPIWLERAEALLRTMSTRFWDEASGGYFNSVADDDTPLIIRGKNPTDTAMPSGNTMAFLSLVLAYEATGDINYKLRAEQLLASFAGVIGENPAAYTYLLAAVQRFHRGSRERVQYAAGGQVRVLLEQTDQGWQLGFSMGPDWHVNHPRLSETSGLIGLEVTGSRFVCPEPEQLIAAFSDTAIPVLAGQFSVTLDDPQNEIQVRIQVCSDQICLAPEILTFRVSGTP